MEDYPKVKRIQDGLGASHIEPAMDPNLSDLEKLRWHAAVTTLDTGLRVLVHPVRGGYSVQVENSSMGSMIYRDAWVYITGVLVGGEHQRKKSE